MSILSFQPLVGRERLRWKKEKYDKEWFIHDIYAQHFPIQVLTFKFLGFMPSTLFYSRENVK